MAKLDADGVARFLIAMRAGDAMVITNEFTPVTPYARYTLISDVTDNGTWVQFTAHLNDSSSPMEGPPLGTRMRVTGFLNTMAGGADISGVAAGYGLTGGGDTGVIPIAADPRCWRRWPARSSPAIPWRQRRAPATTTRASPPPGSSRTRATSPAAPWPTTCR